MFRVFFLLLLLILIRSIRQSLVENFDQKNNSNKLCSPRINLEIYTEMNGSTPEKLERFIACFWLQK